MKILIISFLLISTVNAQEIINHAFVQPHFEIVRKILLAALEETKNDYGPYILKENPKYTQAREVVLTADDKMLNLTWSMTSISREEKLQPVKVPLLMGLIGLRTLIIRKEDKARFEKIVKISELKKIKLGQEKDWPDTEILRSQGFNVFPFSSYNSSFDLLRIGRYDFYPRGVTEPYTEIHQYGLGDLIVDENHAFFYHAPFYFFVSKKNKRLYKRLNDGMERLVLKGKLRELLLNDPIVRVSLLKSKISSRKIHYINNPYFLDEKLKKRKELWLDLENLDELLNKEPLKNQKLLEKSFLKDI